MKRVKWVSIPVALLALLALVTFLPGKPESALAQALEDLKNARTLHVVVNLDQDQAGQLQRLELWAAGEKRFRQEETSTPNRNGKTWKRIVVRNGEQEWRYDPYGNTAVLREGSEHSDLHDLGQWALHPELLIAFVVKEQGEAIQEEESVDQHGRRVRIYTVSNGEKSRGIITLEAKTNRLVAFDMQQLRDGKWQTQGRFDLIEYDIPIPEERFTFVPPPGARVLRYGWWKNRRNQVLDEEEIGEWRLTIHALDVVENGDVILSVSRKRLVKGDYNGAAPPVGRLVDDQGRAYAELNCFGVENEHWTLRFTPVEPVEELKAEKFTIEVNPYPAGSDPHRLIPDPGVLVFDDLPANHLPPGDLGPGFTGDPERDQRLESRLKEARRQAVERYRLQYGK